VEPIKQTRSISEATEEHYSNDPPLYSLYSDEEPANEADEHVEGDRELQEELFDTFKLKVELLTAEKFPQSATIIQDMMVGAFNQVFSI
jgi:hypothetical protein